MFYLLQDGDTRVANYQPNIRVARKMKGPRHCKMEQHALNEEEREEARD